MKKPVVLAILDGFGCTAETKGNAISGAKTPNLTALFQQYAHTKLDASGLSVGLPTGQMGNSEVGHTNIGAGRVVYQDLTRISKSIEDGEMPKNPALLAAVENAKTTGRALHLLGLVSTGGVHSTMAHLFGLLEMAKTAGLTRVFVHCFMDGRDTPPKSGIDFLASLTAKMEELGVGQIATISGRYYAMDRDNRWERVEKAYDAIVLGQGEDGMSQTPAQVMTASYADEKNDEFVLPTVLIKDAVVKANDSVIFFNFRPDRAREITRTIVDPDFSGFARKNGFFPTTYVCLTQYDASMPNVLVAYAAHPLANTFGEYISGHGLRQLRIAETEKYAHVTFFFNGGVETVYPGEDRALIPSPKVATYDLQPEMSAFLVTDELIRRLETDQYDVVILNFANPDMVGHTGVYEAAVKAIETVDTCLGRIVKEVLDRDGTIFITADHGNAEKMAEPDGSPFTAHTTNLVPFLAVSGKASALREGGQLSDIAPTLLHVLGLPKPAEMTGTSLLAE